MRRTAAVAGIGLAGASVASGLLTYVFLAILSRAMPVDEYAHFAVFWSLSLVIGFGLFLPIEQEMSRLSAHAIAPAAVSGAVIRVAGELTLVAVVLLAAMTPVLLPAVGGEWTVVVASWVFVGVSALQFVARGSMLADGRLHRYAGVLTADVTGRVVLSGILALLSLLTAGLGALVMCVSALAAHVWVVVRLHPDRRAGSMIVGQVRRSIGTLVVASLAAAILLNAGPIILSAFSTDPSDAGRFLNVFSLARIPLFVIVPLQSVLVPGLARLLVRGDLAALRTMLARGAAVLLGLAAVGAVVAYFLAAPVIDLVFGPGYALPGADVAVLVVGVVAHVGLVLATQLLVAGMRHRQVAAAWLVGLASAATILLVAGPTARGVELAFGIGSLVGCVCACVLAYVDTRARASLGRSPHPLSPNQEET